MHHPNFDLQLILISWPYAPVQCMSALAKSLGWVYPVHKKIMPEKQRILGQKLRNRGHPSYYLRFVKCISCARVWLWRGAWSCEETGPVPGSWRSKTMVVKCACPHCKISKFQGQARNGRWRSVFTPPGRCEGEVCLGVCNTKGYLGKSDDTSFTNLTTEASQSSVGYPNHATWNLTEVAWKCRDKEIRKERIRKEAVHFALKFPWCIEERKHTGRNVHVPEQICSFFVSKAQAVIQHTDLTTRNFKLRCWWNQFFLYIYFQTDVQYPRPGP